MAIEKTNAIVLRVSPFSATSHIVTWLTRDRGRIATLVKGACRPKSMFLGQYDLHYTCELLYYAREHRGVPIARECTPLKTRNRLRDDWQAAVCAGYAGSLTIQGTMPGQVVPAVYDRLEQFLDFLSDRGAQRNLMPWFELMLLCDLGFSPRFDSCSLCGVPVAAETGLSLAARHGGVLCNACRRRPDAGVQRRVSVPVLAMLCAWQRGDTPRTAHVTACPDEHWLETLVVVGILLAEHLGETPPLRPRAAGLLGGIAERPDTREELS